MFSHDPALSSLADAVLREGCHPVILPEDERARVEPAVRSGLVEVSPEGYAFVSGSTLASAVARQAAADMALHWGDLDAAWSSIRRYTKATFLVKQDQAGRHGDAWTLFFLALQNEHALSPLALMREAAEESRGEKVPRLFWSFYGDFCSALVHLDVDPDALADGLGPVLDAVSGDLAAGRFYGAVKDLAATSEASAAALITAFLKDPARPTVLLAGNALQGLGDLNPERAHQWALDLTASDHSAVRRAGTVALGWLSYSGDGAADRARGSLDRLDELRTTLPLDELHPVVAQALGELATSLPDSAERRRASTGLMEIATGGLPHVQHVAAQIAARQALADPATPWVRDVLGALVGTRPEHVGTFGTIDNALRLLVATAPEWTLGFIRSVVQAHASLDADARTPLPDLMPMTIQGLTAEHLGLVERELTRWFGSGEPALQRAAGDLVAEHRTAEEASEVRPFRLVPDELNDAARTRAAFAVIGYVLDGEDLARLLTSLVWSDAPGESLLALVSTVLADVVLYEYPGAAREHLARLAVRMDTPSPVFEAVRFALVRSHAYFEAISARPQLKELLPPSHRLRRYQAVERERQRELRDLAESSSDIMSLVHKIPLKQGRTWFTERDGGFEAPAELSSFSTTIEIPRSLLNDPLGHQMIRMQWRVRATGEFPDTL